VQLSTDDPESLPLLISLNEYHDGRAYQGRTEISVRPASATYASGLNEALALKLTAASGQPTQKYAYTTYQVNDRPTTTRLLVENPDTQYANSLGGGVLYKVLSTSDFTYQGEDQTNYTDDFKQINLNGSQDLQPIVSFLKWLDTATDQQFEEDLDQWVDVDSFATYLATQEVLANFDSLSGPGRNAYLYVDPESGLLRVISWDLNLAFGGMQMPGDGQQSASPDAEPPTGAPEASTLPGDLGGIHIGSVLESLGGENALVDRFTKARPFADLIERAVVELDTTWFGRGGAEQALDEIVATIPATEGLPQTVIDEEAAILGEAIETGG
jgi:spore coat protein CotH